jgi:hypothetical protein
MIGMQILFTYVPLFNALFHSAPIGWDAWWRILATGVGVYVVIELEKTLGRWWSWRRASLAPASEGAAEQ